MSPGADAQSHNPTHSAWLDKMLPTAERAIAKVWGPQHRACLISTSPRGVDRKGRLTSAVDKKGARSRAFDELRTQVVKALVAGDRDTARSLAETPEFAHAMRLAFSADEAVMSFTEFLVAGDNSWSDGDAGDSVLWICSWLE